MRHQRTIHILLKSLVISVLFIFPTQAISEITIIDEPEVADPSLGSSTSPQIAVDPLGYTTAVWSRTQTGNRSIIFANRYNPFSQSWGFAVPIDNPEQGNGITPQISANFLGKIIAVWTQWNGSRFAIFTNQLNTQTGTWGSPTPIDDTTLGNAFNPDIAMDFQGNTLIVWRQHNGIRNVVYSNYFDCQSKLWQGPLAIDEDALGNSFAPQISMNLSGQAITLWPQDNGSRTAIFSNRFDPNTRSWDYPTPIDDSSLGASGSPQVVIGNRGNAIAAWQQWNGTRYVIFSSRFHAREETWSLQEPIDEPTLNDSFFTQLAFNLQGDAMAVWFQVNGRRKIFANHFDRRERHWQGAHAIDMPDLGDALSPQVAMHPLLAHSTAVWHQNDLSGRFGIFSNQFNGLEKIWLNAFQIDDPLLSNAFSPQVKMDLLGRSYVAWMQSDGSRNAILADIIPSLFSNSRKHLARLVHELHSIAKHKSKHKSHRHRDNDDDDDDDDDDEDDD